MVCRDGKGREKIKWLKDWSWPWRTRVTWQRIQPIIDTPASKAEGVHNLPSPRVDCDNTGHFVHKAIRKSCRENGLEDTLKNVSSFIVNYAEDNAIQLPRRIPGYKRTDLQLLPCSTTKRSVWEQYSVVAVQVGQRSLSYQTFCRVWKQFLLNIMPASWLTSVLSALLAGVSMIGCMRCHVTLVRQGHDQSFNHFIFSLPLPSLQTMTSFHGSVQ